MGPLRRLWCSTIYFTVLICAIYGCDIQGVTNAWLDLSVTDTDTGAFFQGSTENIGEITSATHSGDGLNFGPYFVASHEDSQFVLSLHENFALYERYETLQSFTVSVTFSCTNGNAARTIIFIVSVIDTNNNDPIFTPTEEFSYTVTPPLPPGYQITGCLSDINVEDIDLTTQRIDFNVENGDGLFEIVYDPALTTSKNFRGILRTTNFVRSIPEPLTLTISATDVDLTGDPQRTTYTTVRIESDGEFEFPDEPVFSQAFYLASYSELHEISVDPISLIQGYAENVEFNITGVYSQYFNVVNQNNAITISVTNQLPPEVLLNESQLYLVINAAKELTSGASATIVVQLPEAPTLQFEQQLYEGTIVDNVLSAPVLVLSQGYENGYTVLIEGERSGNFASTTESNIITLTMTALDDIVIEANNVITLQVTADSGTSAATAVLSLIIIKNDTITPLFESNIYSGSYDPTSGIALQDIVLSQGYDETVSFYLEGEHESLFTIINNLNVVNLQMSAVPQEVLDAGRDILLTLSASKARTVGANTAISIALPRARELGFEHPSYIGQIRDNGIALDPISLSIGYNEDVTFNIIGDYFNYFTATNIGNVVTVTTTIPDDVILQNNNIVLILEAEGTNALKASTSIVLEIIKDDTVTPVFSRNIYEATYSVAGALEIEAVTLSQGYDETVFFRIDGEHSQYFTLTSAGNSITLSLPIVPEDRVFNEKTLIFNVIADKPLTVGASAAVAISFPQVYTEPVVLSFSGSSYVGTLENNQLSLDDIVLESGYTTGTEITLTGEYEDSFSLTIDSNIVAISLSNPLPVEALQNNKFVVLQVTAQRERAVPAVATVIIEINTEDEIPPIFAEAYYSGTYTIDGGLQFSEEIVLAQGYNESVTFQLEDGVSEWFTVQQNGNNINLVLSNPIPEETVYANRQLLFSVTANRDNMVARTAVSIDLPDGKRVQVLPPDAKKSPSSSIRFASSSHVGHIEAGILELGPITLLEDYEGATFNLLGDYSDYFNVLQNEDTITLELNASNQLPEAATLDPFIVLDIEATRDAATAYTAVVLEIVRENDPVPTPVFSQPYYSGSYSPDQGLLLEQTISLIQGYSEDVQFTLQGDDAQGFVLTQNGNSVTITIGDGGLPETDRAQLLFSVEATRIEALTGNSAIVINLPNNSSTDLSFASSSHVGRIETGVLYLGPITLINDYEGATFNILENYGDYFNINQNGATITLELINQLPDEVMLVQSFVVLDIEATRDAATAYTAVVLEIVRETDPVPTPVFSQPYYSGSYSPEQGLLLEETISLIQGYSEDVQFTLQGDDAQWFVLTQTGNSVTITIGDGGLPETDRTQLLFSVEATRIGALTGNAAIVINLPNNSSTASFSFASSSHVGRIETGVLYLEPITLIDDYEGATLNILGDFGDYFNINQNGATITLELINQLPDEVMLVQSFVVLDIEATRDAATAYTAVVLEIVRETDPVPTPVFSQPYYSGSYSPEQGLLLEETISLIQGYNEDVQFTLQGDDAQGFVLTQTGNSVTITIGDGGLPETDRAQLWFSVEATRVGALTGNAAIVINLPNNSSTAWFSFASSSHVGRIETGVLYLEPITLIDDYEGATLNILGDYGDYFNINQNGATITLELINQLPDEVMLVQSFVVLDIEATRDAATAYTAVVLEIVRETDPVPTPVFSQPYYSGSYSPEQGLLFEETISLIQGYSEDVQFTLQGDDAQGFVLTQNGNSVTITIGEGGLLETDRAQLLFSVEATRIGALNGNAAIVINLPGNSSIDSFSFASISHVGLIETGVLYLEPIILINDYEGATFNILGDFGDFFNINQNGATITLELINQLPDEVMLVQSFVVLDIEATRDAATAYTAVVLEIVRETDPVPTPVFSQPYYSGSYSFEQGLLLEETISLIQGYSEDVQFTLQGDDAQGFVLTQTGNSVTITIGGVGLPETDRGQLLFSVEATRIGALTGNAAIVINLPGNSSTASFNFASSSHVGRIETGVLYLEPITLIDDYEGATLNILGDYGDYFNINQNGATITLELINQLPDEVMLVQSFVVLDIEATRDAATAYTAVVLEIVRETDPVPTPVFSQPYYSGSYSPEQGLLLEETISLIQGYSEDVQFTLQGDDAQGFVLTQTGNSVAITIGEGGLPETDRAQLLFSVEATRIGALTGNAAIVINLPMNSSTASFSFASSSHVGRIETGVLYLEPITLIDDYEGATLNILGDFDDYFNINQNGATITLELINQLPDEVMLVQSFVVLDIEATRDAATAYTAVVLEIVRETDPVATPVFSQPYYSGSYSPEQGLLFEETISLIQGYSEDVQFTLQGDDAQWFVLSQTGNSVTISIGDEGLPETDRAQLLFSIEANRAGSLAGNAAVFILLSGESGSSVAFDRALYRGIFEGSLQHEPVIVSGYDGTEVEISGEYQDLFLAQAASGVVVVQALESVVFSTDILYVGLELRAGGAHAALLIDIDHSEQPEPPTVVFESSSYEISTDVTQTGLVGRVHATASNGEPIIYSLAIDNAHLQERLSVSPDGELQLFATANTGIYNFAVNAVAAASQVSATATIRMNVEAVAVCGDDEYVVPPLIVINRDEEENYSGLIVLSQAEFPGCRYEMTNRWPLNQDWLYVDDAGLHTTAIDREDESIAFMALSQIQVELILVCDIDDAARETRAKRDLRPDWLGPYDYGNNEWVLTETILYNSRRTILNLIVNDINDNAPVFVDKENEPIAVGYPVADLLQVVTPRALTQLKATDRDIGINAELVYWSSALQLAVGPTTGTVHVRDNQGFIAEGTVMTVHATDQAGEGLTGDIDIVIRLLDDQHIAVITVRDAFEEDEAAILENLTNALGYEVKSLTSAVISDEYDDIVLNANSRRKRQAVESRGASLKLFVYGLMQRDPVDVSQLTNDINNNVIVTVAVADTVSLQDYLASLKICEIATGRDIGLLVATIVLSVVLFMLIVLIGLWFFLRWRKERNYEEFSDMNSIASRNDSSEGSLKVEPITRPRLAIEEIKRSERRLREMLDAPDEEVVTQPTIPTDTIVEIPTSTTTPIVIQSIDKLKDANEESDDDEFGERKERSRKKSVVTFNENVEKIIHVEDDPDDNDDDIEIYKL